MTMKSTAVLLGTIALAAALTLVACGGGSDPSASTSTTVETAPQSAGEGQTGGAEGESGDQVGSGHRREDASKAKDRSTSSGDGSGHVPVAPLEVSGGGSAQFRVKGGDNSVQDYGGEAGDSELRQAAEATHSFLVASVRGEWARACELLTAPEQKSLEQLAAQSPQLSGQGCAAALAAVTQTVSGPLAQEITSVDAAGLRREGKQGFLIYVGAPAGTVYAMPLRLEGGVWRLSAISGSPLPGVPAD